MEKEHKTNVENCPHQRNFPHPTHKKVNNLMEWNVLALLHAVMRLAPFFEQAYDLPTTLMNWRK